LSQNSSWPNKQNELITALRKQLAATERELAGQKWLFEQFLKSPSWRLTYPIRWLARQMRRLRQWFAPAAPQAMASEEEDFPNDTTLSEDIDAALGLKEFFTTIFQLTLKSFLTSNSSLDVPHSDDPVVSVIVVLFNRAELTLACMRSLAENRSERLEIIIVDNNSSDETPLLLQRLRGAKIIRNSENVNFLMAVNQAARHARGEYLLLLNNDAQILPGTLEAALNTIRSAPDIGAVGGRLVLLDGTLQEAGSIIWRDGSCLGYGRGDAPFAPMYMFRRDVDYCSGAFLLTPRTIWNRLGGFDELFKPAYYEETDYCSRLWENGLRVVYEPNAVVLHYEFASSSSQKTATELQREHQSTFVDRHRQLLSTHSLPDVNAILSARMRNGGRRALYIDDRVPHEWLGSGFPRAQTIIRALLKEQFFITFYPLSLVEEDWHSVYSDMTAAIEFVMGYGSSLLEAFLRNRRGYYEVIFISRPHNMKIIRPILSAHPDWFETTDIVYDAEALFVTRETTLRQLRGTDLHEDEVDTMIQEEVDLARAGDCIIAVSESDRVAFLDHGVENVYLLGHSLEVQTTPRSFQDREGFLFVGAIHEEASPNGDSVIWFLEEVLPKIQASLGADIPFTIAGVNESSRIKELAGPNVHITGTLPSLAALYDQARVFVAPTRYAAGIPHKVHQAAARGVPVVATPLLAAQLGWGDGDLFLVGTDAQDFASKCVELYKNEELWTTLRRNALERVQVECSVEAFEARLKHILKDLRQRRLQPVNAGIF
jgi:O-antigen biosynthesis protein